MVLFFQEIDPYFSFGTSFKPAFEISSLLLVWFSGSSKNQLSQFLCLPLFTKFIAMTLLLIHSLSTFFFIPLKTFRQWDVINSLLRLNSAFIQMSTPPGSTGISRVDPTSHSSLTGLKAISALVSLRIVLALGIKQKVGFAFQESFFFPWLFLCKLLEIVLSMIIYCTWVWVLELVCPSQDWEEACVWWGRAETKQLMTLYHLDSQLSESTKISHFLFLFFFLQSTYSDLGSCGDPAYKM